VAANVAAFAWQLGVGLDASTFRGGAIPYEVLTLSDVDLPDVVPPPFTVLTSMFLHSGFLHAASNLLFLWIFGGPVEGALGRRRFGGFYLATGIAAALCQIVAAAATRRELVPIVGASGAIAGVLAAYATLFPRARVLSRLPVPTSAFIGVWLALQVGALVLGRSPEVALFAHIGGFVAGWILVRTIGRRRTFRADHSSG
jgi:membrane associated rhomboid family serine protease